MRKFIEDNNITFEEGERNSSIVILIGYAQHLGLSKDKLKEELSKEIVNDSFLGQEIDRLYRYCEDRKYKKFWTTAAAKKAYIF